MTSVNPVLKGTVGDGGPTSKNRGEERKRREKKREIVLIPGELGEKGQGKELIKDCR